MENHSNAELLFSYESSFSAAVVISTFEIYSWKLTGYLILICSFNSCYENWSCVHRANGMGTPATYLRKSGLPVIDLGPFHWIPNQFPFRFRSSEFSGSSIGFSGPGISLIWSSGFGIWDLGFESKIGGESRDWKYAWEVWDAKITPGITGLH